MKKIFVILVLAIGFSCNAQNVDSLELFDPNDVFVVAEDVEQQQHLAACQMVAGVWH